MKSERGPKTMAAYDRILRVLASFDVDNPPRSLSEIAEAVDLPMSTAHRVLAQLTAWGALERAEDRRYVIGTRMFEIGSRAPKINDHRDSVHPFVRQLAEATGHHAYLALADSTDPLVVASVLGDSPVRSVTIGARLPAEGSAAGLVVQAFGAVPATTARDAVSVKRRALLRDVRRTSVAIGRGGVTVSFAAPVFDESQQLWAIIGLTAPAATSDIGRFAGAVVRASRMATAALDETASDRDASSPLRRVAG